MCTDLVSFRIKEKVGPVWISLHVLKLKKLPQAQHQDLLTNLTKIERKLKSIKVLWSMSEQWVSSQVEAGLLGFSWSLAPRSWAPAGGRWPGPEGSPAPGWWWERDGRSARRSRRARGGKGGPAAAPWHGHTGRRKHSLSSRRETRLGAGGLHDDVRHASRQFFLIQLQHWGQSQSTFAWANTLFRYLHDMHWGICSVSPSIDIYSNNQCNWFIENKKQLVVSYSWSGRSHIAP